MLTYFALLFSLVFVGVPGLLLSMNLDALSQNTVFINASVIVTLLIFGALVAENYRKLAHYAKQDFNQNKIDIIHSSFILMEGEDSVDKDAETEQTFVPHLASDQLDNHPKL